MLKHDSDDEMRIVRPGDLDLDKEDSSDFEKQAASAVSGLIPDKLNGKDFQSATKIMGKLGKADALSKAAGGMLDGKDPTQNLITDKGLEDLGDHAKNMLKDEAKSQAKKGAKSFMKKLGGKFNTDKLKIKMPDIGNANLKNMAGDLGEKAKEAAKEKAKEVAKEGILQVADKIAPGQGGKLAGKAFDQFAKEDGDDKEGDFADKLIDGAAGAIGGKLSGFMNKKKKHMSPMNN